MFTKGFLAVNIPDNYPEIKNDKQLLAITSTNIEASVPVSRAVFRLERAYDLGPLVDGTPRYTEKFFIAAQVQGLDRPVLSI